MKKFTLFLAALLTIGSLSAKTIYLNGGGGSLWNQSGAIFYIHAWGENDVTSDVLMTALPNDPNIYQAEIDDACTDCLFTRNDPQSTSIWDKEWNRTINLSIEDNCFTITAWGDKGSVGEWSHYTPSTERPDYYIAGSKNLYGSEWDPAGLKMTMTETGYTHTFQDLQPDTYEFKITNGTWTASWGFSSVDTENSSENVFDKGGNVTFILAEQGDVTVEFVDAKIIITGAFIPYTEPTNTIYYVNTSNWENIHVYAFGGTKPMYWPGEMMTKTEDTKNGCAIYSFEVAESHTTIIFNDGKDAAEGGQQTKDLIIDPQKPYCYKETWYASVDEIPNEPVTAIENNNDDHKVEKVISNGQLYLIRNGHTYTATGAMVK